MTVGVRSSDDAAEALAAAGDFLRAEPVDNNLLLSLLSQRVGRPEPGRYWWASDAGAVVGFAFQSPPTFRATLARAERHVVEALVDAMVDDAPDIPGVSAEAATAAAFAGQWAERRRVPATPTEGQRLYRLGHLRPPTGVPGHLRPPVPGDTPTQVAWAAGFLAEVGAGPISAEEIVDRHVATGGLRIWDDGGPVSTAAASPTVAGVARIGYVFTPPEHRGRGYAAACVAALSGLLQADGVECVLYTQLHNPTSNAVYRRIGYEPAVELVVYRFGGPGGNTVAR